MHQDETQYSLSYCSARECLYYFVSVECFLRSCYKYTLSYVNVLALLAYSYSLSIISKVQFKQSLLWH